MPTLDFKGKPFVYSHHLSVPFRELKVDAGRSVAPEGGKADLDGNLIIHGDNLEALKALLPRYAGKVDVIYIDPPYNTGNEGWAYNDNVNSPLMKNWLGQVVDREDLERHDKWCCMIWPRLQILRDLMSEESTIWISCDDNEVGSLKLLMSELFGEDNFLGNMIWQKVFSPKNSARYVSEDHDYILVYAKDVSRCHFGRLPRTEEMESRYTNEDDDHRGPWTSGDLAARNFYSEGRYPIACPSGRTIDGPPAGSYWRYSKKRFEELNADGRIWWGKDGDNMPRLKRFLSEVQDGRVVQTLWKHDEVGNTQGAKRELIQILGLQSGEDVFLTPKPASLIERVLTIASRAESLIRGGSRKLNTLVR